MMWGEELALHAASRGVDHSISMGRTGKSCAMGPRFPSMCRAKLCTPGDDAPTTFEGTVTPPRREKSIPR